MIIAKINYNGLLFQGSQYQKNKRTIQNILTNFFKCDTHFFSRTDKFVSAIDQLVVLKSKYINKKRIEEFNISHQDIKITSFTEDNINLSNIINRKYKYFIKFQNDIFKPLASFVYTKQKDIFIKKLRIKLYNFQGFRDFSKFSFKNEVFTTKRILFFTQVIKTNNGCVIELIGNGFLRRMIRHLISFCVNKIQKQDKYLISPNGLFFYGIGLDKEVDWKTI